MMSRKIFKLTSQNPTKTSAMSKENLNEPRLQITLNLEWIRSIGYTQIGIYPKRVWKGISEYFPVVDSRNHRPTKRGRELQK